MTKKQMTCEYIFNHTCRECGSENYRYSHEFIPEENRAVLYFECLDCGEIEQL